MAPSISTSACDRLHPLVSMTIPQLLECEISGEWNEPLILNSSDSPIQALARRVRNSLQNHEMRSSQSLNRIPKMGRSMHHSSTDTPL